MNFNKSGTFLRLAAGVIVLPALTACGMSSGNWVKNAAISTYQSGNDTYGKVTVGLSTNGMILPALDVPIIDPKNPSVAFGEFSILPNLTTGADLGVAVNLSRLVSLPSPGASPTLPNGMMIPVSGISPNSLYAFSVGGNRTQIYLDLNMQAQSAMLGIAIPIAQLDQVGSYTGGLVNIFPSFQLQNGVAGTAGVFTGMQPGQSGLALFMNVSSLLNQAIPMAAVQTRSVGPRLPAARFASQKVTAVPHEYLDVSTGSSSAQWQVMKKLSDMSSRRTKLDIR